MRLLPKSVTLLLLGAIVAFLSSCCAMMDNLEDCPQGINFQKQVTTPCNTEAPDPDDLKHLKQVLLCGFNEEGTLEWMYLDLTKNPILSLEWHRVGTTQVIAWGSEDLSKYDFTAFKKGAKLTDLTVTAPKKQGADGVEHIEATLPALYVATLLPPTTTEEAEELARFGTTVSQGKITQSERKDKGTVYDLVTLDFRQLSNRINFDVRGLQGDGPFTIRIKAMNSRYDALGNMLEDTPFYYTTTSKVENGVLKATFDILKLQEEKPYTIEILDGDKVINTYDLLTDIILHPQKSKLIGQLQCQHKFDIEIGTNISVTAGVLSWNIVTRGVIGGE